MTFDLQKISHSINEFATKLGIPLETLKSAEKGKVFDLYIGELTRSAFVDLNADDFAGLFLSCLLYTSPSPRDQRGSRMPSSA